MSASAAFNDLSSTIIGSAIEVHRHLGPGLLESAYLKCLVFEIRALGLTAELNSPVPIVYKKVTIDCGYRLDLIVAQTVIVEVKSVSELSPIHHAQLLTYLRLTGLPLGLLLNFNVPVLKDGIKRMINTR